MAYRHALAYVRLPQCALLACADIVPENARAATEVIFACWESARRRGRVTLPLDIEDNPLQAMVEAGDLLHTKTPPSTAHHEP